MKTMKENIQTGAKYSGSSIVLGYSITNIITFAFPDLKAVEADIMAILTFVLNMLLVVVFKYKE